MKDNQTSRDPRFSLIASGLRFFLEKRVIVLVMILLAVGWGILVSPFDWQLGGPFRDPVPVDAIPDIGENQQIVFTQWPGRSPQDIEDQITYPLTVSLLGIPGVKTVRSFSMFGFSSIYVIFQENTDFYWSRSRILEKLNSLPDGALPESVRPALGPDATAMGQVFWYTLEGRDEKGTVTGGWDLHELRTVQDWHVRYALMSVEGVSEVASVGGFVQEYQVDLDPDLMRAYDVTLNEVVAAVKGANRDVGAQTLEINRVEYVVRGLGFIKGLEDIENAVIKLRNGMPVFVRQVAGISLGPASRQGALDKGGAETVGGVVAVRYGENPLAVIEGVKSKIKEISPGMPRKTLPDGTVTQVSVIPFYDRTQLINETLDTLRIALSNEILITIIVILVAIFHLGSSLLIAGLLPLSVLMCFIGMKIFGVDANIVALSGIAIAIGTMVDMGIIVVENILRHLRSADPREDRLSIVLKGTQEVSGAVLTAVATTIVSFLPVFTMEGAEGKLFRPLAFSKTFALFSSLVVALIFIPPLTRALFSTRLGRRQYGWVFYEAFIYLGGILAIWMDWRVGLAVALVGGYNLIKPRIPPQAREKARVAVNVLIAIGVAVVLARYWLPLGPEKGLFGNLSFVFLVMGSILGGLRLFYGAYDQILTWCLDHKALFLMLPLVILLLGGMIWQGYAALFGWLPKGLRESSTLVHVAQRFPGLESEFMPPLDEGSYLFMPTTMPHASIGEVLDILQKQDVAIQNLPEVKTVVGKLGRAQSPLDPAPVSMIETLVTYKPKYLLDKNGDPLRFRFNPIETGLFRNYDGRPLLAPDKMPYRVKGRFLRDKDFHLIPDPDGRPFRVWRPPLDPALNPGRKPWAGINRPDDIWDALVQAARVPGTTSAARLQPISARMVMLQSGIRAKMGIKVTGPDLETIQRVSLNMEGVIRDIPSIDPATVIADRVISKPYLEIHLDRQALAQYGIRVEQVLEVIEVAIGGKRITATVEGRERYPVRVRYVRELRDDLEVLGKILVPAPDGTQIPLMQMAEITYVRGPGVIKAEDTFLVGYVLFDKKEGFAEVEVIDQVAARLKEAIDQGELVIPDGASYAFTGTYENQQRAEKRLAIILPLALLIIFVILYLQFNSVATTSLVFSGIAVAWSGGFIMLWLYAQPWFLDFSLFGVNMRDLFQVHPLHLSVAVWVGFLALFGIASDDGVVMATYLDDAFRRHQGSTISEIRKLTMEASLRRVRPCLMTTATTLLALIPVLTSTGRGSDIMIPMAIPSFGGMAVEVVTMLVVPVLYCAIKEHRLKRVRKKIHRNG
ncbi:MAG: efflux RND transporter permease subunit [Deltaproteobacteria bacterium]|nr:efflux RND transporter permease subunit [Deltaproteobacteria bacterium]